MAQDEIERVFHELDLDTQEKRDRFSFRFVPVLAEKEPHRDAVSFRISDNTKDDDGH